MPWVLVLPKSYDFSSNLLRSEKMEKKNCNCTQKITGLYLPSIWSLMNYPLDPCPGTAGCEASASGERAVGCHVWHVAEGEAWDLFWLWECMLLHSGLDTQGCPTLLLFPRWLKSNSDLEEPFQASPGSRVLNPAWSSPCSNVVAALSLCKLQLFQRCLKCQEAPFGKKEEGKA